jgi:hypothetical protein
MVLIRHSGLNRVPTPGYRRGGPLTGVKRLDQLLGRDHPKRGVYQLFPLFQSTLAVAKSSPSQPDGPR